MEKKSQKKIKQEIQVYDEDIQTLKKTIKQLNSKKWKLVAKLR